MKYGIKSVIRTPVKSILFFLLITAITVFLSLGMGMWNAAENMLDEADQVFMSAGEFVYKGGNYPNRVLYDEFLYETFELFSLENYRTSEVLLMEESISQRVYLEEYVPRKRDMPFREYSVLTVTVNEEGWSMLEDGELHYVYLGTVMDANYSERQVMGGRIRIPSDNQNLRLENGKYVLTGYFSYFGNRISTFQIASPPYSGMEEELIIEESIFPNYVDVSDYEHIEEFWSSEVGIYYQDVIDTLKISNRSVEMVASSNLQGVSAFHMGEYTLEEGSYFSEEDYVNGKVCIIPYRVASQMELSVGDKIPLAFHYPSNQGGMYGGYIEQEGFIQEEEYQVVGIYAAEDYYTPIYIPYAGEEWLRHSTDDYCLGRVILDNRGAKKYAEEVNQRLPANVVFQYYDQGYEASVTSILSMKSMAVLIMAGCIVAGMITLCFFAYFMCYLNRDNARILLALGAGKGRVRRFLFSGSGLIGFAAASIGSLCGYVVSTKFINQVYSFVSDNSVFDFRFSRNGYGISSGEFVPEPYIDSGVFCILAGVIFMISLCISFLFIQKLIHMQNPTYRYKKQAKKMYQKEKKQQKDVQAKRIIGEKFTLKIPFVSLRYAVKTMLRGGFRSFIVPILFTILLLFMCVFSFIQNRFSHQLATVYDDVPVLMQFCDVTGRRLDQLVIDKYQFSEIEETGFVENSWETRNFRCKSMGVISYGDGTINEEEREIFEIPMHSIYAYEAFMYRWAIESTPMIMTDDINSTPRFFYAEDIVITWAEGVEEQNLAYGVVPDYYLEDNSYSIGDVISLVIMFEELTYTECSFLLAGSYESMSRDDAIFISEESLELALKRFVSYIDLKEEQILSVYHSGGFLLKNTEQLSDLKDILETKYDPLGKTSRYRKWIQVDDGNLYHTIDSLNRYILYMNLLYPIILMLVVGIAFLISNLLLRSRSNEIGVLRSLGSSKWGVFLSLFLEPLLLSLPGIICGLVLSCLLTGGWQQVYLQNTGLLMACYYIGAMIAILRTFHKAVMESLKQNEE